ncbi:hypothetical protein [Geminisphaera colitermitum]|uniref:hypothetical protein n=1 Tax=Geminisphaera colitermitum TaxID=1148786 RepID=UPI000693807E|nr:hypothetical protein [Geminisphaera colitermitum]
MNPKLPLHYALLSLLFATQLQPVHAAALVAPAAQRTIHVDATRGDDANDGIDPTRPLRTLHRATQNILPGDTLLVAPGVYRGGITLTAKGTPQKPIRILATDHRENATIITNAAPALRIQPTTTASPATTPWQLEDPALALYSAPHAAGLPPRILYSGADLFPYRTLDALTTFTLRQGSPGPRHGYYYDAAQQKLYLRLNPNGRYGSLNPADHLIAVAPPTGGQFDGTLVSSPDHYNIGILGSGPAHAIIDGFTFETPGVCGVYSEADYVTIRRSWFRGCRVGVAGNYTDKLPTPEATSYITYRLDPDAAQKSASRITIEYCDYTQHPAFQDVVDVLAEHPAATLRSWDRKPKIALIWARKDIYSGDVADNRLKYEMGLAARIAADWVIHRNTIHDAMEGLSCHATSASTGLRVTENHFERICDNAIEAEEHARDLWIECNVFLDTFEPYSWQPLRGTPWPGPVYFLQNIAINTPFLQNLWTPIVGPTRSPFKIGAKPDHWRHIPHMKNFPADNIIVPPPGMIFAHNTVLWDSGRLITPQGDPATPIQNTKFQNNIFVTALASSRDAKKDLRPGVFQFENNYVAPSTRGAKGPGEIAAGSPATTLPDTAALKLSPATLTPLPGSPLIGAARPLTSPTPGVPLPDEITRKYSKFQDIGAIQPGDTWYPLKTGPLAAPHSEAF